MGAVTKGIFTFRNRQLPTETSSVLAAWCVNPKMGSCTRGNGMTRWWHGSIQRQESVHSHRNRQAWQQPPAPRHTHSSPPGTALVSVSSGMLQSQTWRGGSSLCQETPRSLRVGPQNSVPRAPVPWAAWALTYTPHVVWTLAGRLQVSLLLLCHLPWGPGEKATDWREGQPGRGGPTQRCHQGEMDWKSARRLEACAGFGAHTNATIGGKGAGALVDGERPVRWKSSASWLPHHCQWPCVFSGLQELYLDVLNF